MAKKLIIIIGLVLLQNLSHRALAQTSKRIDSLKNLLSHAQEDTSKVRLLNDLSYTYSEFDTIYAFSYAKQAILLAKKLGDSTGVARGNRAIGNSYYNTQNFKTALDYYSKSLEISKSVSDKESEASSLNNIGIVYMGWGGYTAALENLHKASKLYEELGDMEGVGITAYNMAILYGYTEGPHKSIEYLNKALEKARKHNIDRIIPELFYYLGYAYYSLKEYHTALNYFESSHTEAKKQETIRIIGNSRALTAETHMKLQQYDSAQVYIDEALNIGKKIGDQWLINLSTKAQANYNAHHKRYDKAITILKDNIDTLENRKMAGEVIYTYKNLKEIYKAKGDFANALITAEKINQLEDSLHQAEKIKSWDAVQTYYESEKKEMQIATLKKEAELKTMLDYLWLALFTISVSFIAILINRMLIRRKAYQETKQRLEAENKLAAAEKQQIKAELESKNRELASSVLYLGQKNNLLHDLKEGLNNIQPHNGSSALINDFNKMIDNSLSLDQEWEKFTLHFDKVHPNFFKKLQEQYPDLTPNDLKECAYIKINLSSKEVANLMNISPDSVKVRRHRIKKKMDLPATESLSSFIGTL